MAKLVKQGYTDYFGPSALVTLLSFDNNKYVHIQKADGNRDTIKRSYVYADAALTRKIPEINWHILGGGQRKAYRPRVRATTFEVWVGTSRSTFSSKRGAVAFASRIARESGQHILVSSTLREEGPCRVWVQSEITYIECQPGGFAVQLSRSSVQGRMHKYLRGYGRLR